MDKCKEEITDTKDILALKTVCFVSIIISLKKNLKLQTWLGIAIAISNTAMEEQQLMTVDQCHSPVVIARIDTHMAISLVPVVFRAN